MIRDLYTARKLYSIEHYDKLANQVQQKGTVPFLNTGIQISGHSNTQEAIYNHLFNYINPTNKTLLEVGCGFGMGCNFIKNQYNIQNIVGCDINDNVLRLARQKFPSITFENCSAVDLVKLNKTFDIVITIETAQYWICHPNGFNSFRDVIGDGGSLLIATDINPKKIKLNEKFAVSGFRLEAEHDLTPNVVLALENRIKDNKATFSDVKKYRMYQDGFVYTSKHYVRE